MGVINNFNNLSKLFRYENANGDSVTFNWAGGYLINKPVGIDTIPVSLTQAVGINQIGATIQGRSVKPRPVNVTGLVVGEDHEECKERLLSVIRPDVSGKLYADDFYLNVYPTATPAIEGNGRFSNFQFSLLAAYPYWCSVDISTTRLAGVEPMFKFPWNLTEPYRFGTVVQTQFFNIYNGGQVPAPFTATFTASGEVKNPQITNAATGEYLRLKKAMSSGERITVEITHDRTYVTSSVDGDCRGALDLKNTLYALAVGDNVLKPEATSGRDSLQIDISFSPERVGVSV